MKISTEIDSIAGIIGEEKAVETVAAAGFDAWDFSMFRMANYDWRTGGLIEDGHPLSGGNYAAFAKKLRHIGEECGIFCNQSHAPFPVKIDKIRAVLPRAIECTAIAGGKICVVHPNNDLSPEENAELYFELMPVAHEYGVKIATENMWNWNADTKYALPAACSDHDNFLSHIRAVNDPFLVACVDIGHAEMAGLGTSAAKMIETLGPAVQALHIHDNDLRYDRHWIPFAGSIDYAPIVSALKKIGYGGEFTLEASYFVSGHTAEEVPGLVSELAGTAEKLAKMFDAD